MQNGAAAVQITSRQRHTRKLVATCRGYSEWQSTEPGSRSGGAASRPMSTDCPAIATACDTPCTWTSFTMAYAPCGTSSTRPPTAKAPASTLPLTPTFPARACLLTKSDTTSRNGISARGTKPSRRRLHGASSQKPVYRLVQSQARSHTKFSLGKLPQKHLERPTNAAAL